MSTVLAIFLLLLSAIFKAVSDTLQHHYSTSIFKNLNPGWWNPAVSWQKVKLIPFTSYRPDAWHLSNSFMIVCFVLFGTLYGQLFNWWIDTIILGAVWILMFNLFYDKVLRRW